MFQFGKNVSRRSQIKRFFPYYQRINFNKNPFAWSQGVGRCKCGVVV